MEGNPSPQSSSFSDSDIELDLIQRSQQRDKLAFGKLVDQYWRWLYAIAVAHLWINRDAEDIVQESLLSAWTELPNLRDSSKFRAWLAKIVVNRCKNWKRGQQRKTVFYSDLSEQEQQDIEQTVDESIQIRQKVENIQEQFETCMKKIPMKYRTILCLRYLSDCSIDEISKTMQMSKPAVRMAIFYGRNMLKKQYKEDSNDEKIRLQR